MLSTAWDASRTPFAATVLALAQVPMLNGVAAGVLAREMSGRTWLLACDDLPHPGSPHTMTRVVSLRPSTINIANTFI